MSFSLAPAIEVNFGKNATAGERVGVRGNSTAPHPGPLPTSSSPLLLILLCGEREKESESPTIRLPASL